LGGRLQANDGSDGHCRYRHGSDASGRPDLGTIRVVRHADNAEEGQYVRGGADEKNHRVTREAEFLDQGREEIAEADTGSVCLFKGIIVSNLNFELSWKK
jgi:hypothetical protein